MSGLFFSSGCFVPRFLFSLWIFGEYDACVLSVSLVCSAGVLTGNDYWYWRWDTGLSWRKEGWKRTSL